jgi:hypothetical protein
MGERYHLDTDDLPLCTEDGSSKYRSMIGCCVWITALERFDTAYAISATIRFNMSPRAGHLKAIERIFSYLKTFTKGRLIIDSKYPDHSILL